MRFVITFDEHRASRICRIPRFIGARNHRVFYILEGRDIDAVFILLLHRESRRTVVRPTNGKFIARLSARTTSTREFSASSRTGATRRCSPFAFVSPRVVLFPPLSLSQSVSFFLFLSLFLPLCLPFSSFSSPLPSSSISRSLDIRIRELALQIRHDGSPLAVFRPATSSSVSSSSIDRVVARSNRCHREICHDRMFP